MKTVNQNRNRITKEEVFRNTIGPFMTELMIYSGRELAKRLWEKKYENDKRTIGFQ